MGRWVGLLSVRVGETRGSHYDTPPSVHGSWFTKIKRKIKKKLFFKFLELLWTFWKKFGILYVKQKKGGAFL